MAAGKKILRILGLTLFVIFAYVSVTPAQENLSTGAGSGAAPLIRLAASDGGRRALIQERNVRDSLINDPPFSYGEAGTEPPGAPLSQGSMSAFPTPVKPAYAPAAPPAPAAMPELLVRGYSMDPSGAVNIIGMDGVIRTVDGSRPIKLVFPPEYGLAPQIVGGARAAAPPPAPVVLEEIAVRGYSIDPSGAIIIIGMDGLIRVIDGSRPVKLVFPPEYNLAPQVVGGAAAPPAGSQAQSYGPASISAAPQGSGAEVQGAAGGVELPVDLISEGVGVLLKQINKGKSKKSRRD